MKLTPLKTTPSEKPVALPVIKALRTVIQDGLKEYERISIDSSNEEEVRVLTEIIAKLDVTKLPISGNEEPPTLNNLLEDWNAHIRTMINTKEQEARLLRLQLTSKMRPSQL